MRSHKLPPARAYVYRHVTIDLDRAVAVHPDETETDLTGSTHALLALLLAYPGRVLSYGLLARELVPELQSDRLRRWSDLDRRQQTAIKHALQSLAYRTRCVLGERPGTPSILINHTNLGYAIRRPLHVTDGQEPDGSTPRPA